MQTNLSGQVDRILLVPHVWSQTKTWDPEGSSPPSPPSRRRSWPARRGVGPVRPGPVQEDPGPPARRARPDHRRILWGEAAPSWLLFPVNKNIWTSSFVFLTGGLAAALFGLTYWSWTWRLEALATRS